MKREILITSDGSSTIHLPDWNEQYHSKNGSINETYHVFIKSGLQQVAADKVAILEIGFGTGLNAMLTYVFGKELNTHIEYHGLEAFPVNAEELTALNYEKLPFIKDHTATYEQIHTTKWNALNTIEDTFKLNKIEQELQTYHPEKAFFDLIYFDAFGPRVQNEMWSLPIFEKLFASLKQGGVLVTYCAKGQVKRDLKSAGFSIESIPGPPGKREMTRAVKLIR